MIQILNIVHENKSKKRANVQQVCVQSRNYKFTVWNALHCYETKEFVSIFFFAKRYFTVACTYVYVCQPKLTVCVNDLTSIHVCYQCLMLSVPDATSAWCYQCLMRPVPDVISVWCDQYLMLPVPDVSSTWWLIERVDKAAPFAGRRGLRCSVGHLPASHPASSSPSRSPVVTYSPSRSHVHAAMKLDTRRVTSLVVVDVLQWSWTVTLRTSMMYSWPSLPKMASTATMSSPPNILLASSTHSLYLPKWRHIANN